MSKLKIAIQKSGRLNEDSMKILKDVGISIDNGKDQLKASAKNFPLEVFYLRNGDIPQYLKDGVVDVAIIGENVLVEKGSVCINGVSLTCFEVTDDSFKVAIIPYTFEHTNFKKIKKNDEVNIEFDIIGKYVHKLVGLNKK